MEFESLLPSRQQPAICPNPEPDQSNQRPPSYMYIRKIHFCINLPSTSGSSTLLHQNLCVLFAYVLRAPAYLIILYLITRIVLGEECACRV